MIWDNRRVWRPAGLFGLEMLEVTRRQKVELEEAELKMLRFCLGETRTDRMRNEHIRGTTEVGRLGDAETRLS